MIVGVGTDIVSIQRIRDAVSVLGSRFVNRVLTEKEKAEYVKRNFCFFYLAKRFAAKEAIGKALGTGIATEFSVLNDELGKPFVDTDTYNVHISLSDDAGFAVAYVIIESSLS